MTQPDNKKRDINSKDNKAVPRKAANHKKTKAEAEKKTNKKQLQKKKVSKKRSQPFTIFLTTLLVIFITVLFAIGGALIGGYVGIINSIPDLGVVGIKPGSYTSYIYDSEGEEIGKLHGNENREYVTLDQIPEYMQNAVIAIEDERFYEHDGVDIKGFMRAAYSTLTNKQLQGGSTITQQLIKNNITKVTRNTLKTKIKEQYLALKYEKVLTEQYNGSKEDAKKYILELYLNTIGLGHGYNGVKVAAEGYFGKEPKDLTLAECACIAGITNNPSLYSPRTNPENNKKRQTTILNYMLAQGLITQEEYDNAINEDIYSGVRSANVINEDGTTSDTVIHSYYEDATIDQVSTDLQTKYNMTSKQASKIIYDGGLQIYSNLDKNIQEIVDDEYKDDDNFPWVTYCYDATYTVSVENNDTGEQTHSDYQEFARSKEEAMSWAEDKKAEVKANLASNEQIVAEKVNYSPQPQSSMAIIDYHTGEVKAISGGRGEKTVNRAFNRATDSTRQPGSVFKPLAAYAPAFDLGKMNAATIVVDEPYSTADGYTPKNWWGNSYRGAVTARTGLKDSMNIVAVKIMVATGIDLCYDYLLNFGFTTLENDNHASTALGGLTNGVTQVEVAAAYGTLANNGEYLRPMFYSKVLDHDGNILLENTQEPTQVVKSSTAFILTDLMTSVVTEGTGTAARFRNTAMPISGKTGTTTDSKDLTFVGYTPYYVASIWLGYDRYNDKVKNMSNINQSAHLKIWRDVMEKVHEDLEVIDFPVPDTVEKATVCKYTGKQASYSCPSVTGYFEKGTPATEEWCSGSHRGIEAFGGGNIYSGYTGPGSSSTRSRNNSSSSSSESTGSESGDNGDNTGDDNSSSQSTGDGTDQGSSDNSQSSGASNDSASTDSE
ncbi:MAG: transglycosylase domain-containing protein [Lachnospirales bacterium]